MAILAAFMVPHPPMIVPDIGRGSEAQIEETTRAYERVADEIAALEPETIIITTPHSVMYRDYFHISPGGQARGSFGRFGEDQVRFEERYDEELRDAVCGMAEQEQFPAGTLGEIDPKLDHGVMVPLWFIRKRYQGGKILRIGLSGLPLADHYRLGQIIQRAAGETGRRAVFVASGDLSHKLQYHGPYGFAEEGPQYDERIMDVCGRGAFGELFDFDEDFCEKAAECGHRSFVIMAGALDGVAVRPSRLSHQDVTGVGYGICTFYPEGPDDARRFLDGPEGAAEDPADPEDGSDEYVKLARASLGSYIRKHKVLEVPDGLPAEMLEKQAGVFVSIHKDGQLRGCIGTIGPTQPTIADEIIRNAISASTRDPRFAPITGSELPELEISVDVLGDPEEIGSEDQLDVKEYGVIVSNGYRRGLLLPDLEGIETPQQQVLIAKHKAGIGMNEKVKLERFRVIRHR